MPLPLLKKCFLNYFMLLCLHKKKYSGISRKSAIAVARQYGGRKRNFNGESLWARGYAVSTVGFELEEVVRHIKDQNKRDQQKDEGDF